MRVYSDRFSAGRKLLEELKGDFDLVVAIPRGGVAVAYPISSSMKLPLRTVGVKKLAPFHSPESGFGAVAVDGSTFVDEAYMNLLGVDYEELEEIKEVALREAKDKHFKFNGVKPDEVEGKRILVVDDGIATGFTAVAVSEYLRNCGAEKLTLAVPVASSSAYTTVLKYYDDVICPYVVDTLYFAVGAFYRDFHQLTDEEVLELLSKSRNWGTTASGR